MRQLVAFSLVILFSTAGCRSAAETATPDIPETMTITSPAFAEGDVIPAEFTCEGPYVSPPLEWSGVPDAPLCSANRRERFQFTVYALAKDVKIAYQDSPVEAVAMIEDAAIASGRLTGITDT